MVRPLIVADLARVERVRDALRTAFASTPVPRLLTDHRCDECEAIAAAFTGHTWRTIPVGTLARHLSAISLLSHEAFRHFAPAFALAALANESDDVARADRDDLLEFFVYAFLPPDERSAPEHLREWRAARLGQFSAGERAALRAWLALIADAAARDDIRADAARALDELSSGA